MKKLYIYIIGVMLMLPAAISAQTEKSDTTMTRTVVVENEYTPDILDAQKINVMPKVEPLQATQRQVVYDTSQSLLTNLPGSVMPIFTAKTLQTIALPGYIRLGAGLPGNIDFLANYRFTITDRDQLNLFALFNGNKGDRKFEDGGEWKDARFFQTRAGIDYTHAFDQLKLDLGGHVGVSNFNRLVYNTKQGNQNFTSGDVHVGVRSADDNQAIVYNVETNLMLYRRNERLDNKAKETGLLTKGNVLAPITEDQSVGIGFQLDNRFYSLYDYESNHHIDLNPYYVYENNDWSLHLGAHVGYGFGLENKLRVAPDVNITHNFNNSYQFYARATGGNLMNDFRRLELLSPYGWLSGLQPRSTFEQVNAAIGVKGSPVDGLWFNVFGGYQNLKNDAAFGEFASYYLDDGYYLYDVPDGSVSSAYPLFFQSLYQADTHNFYGGAELDYTYKGQISIHASGIYRGWGWEKDNYEADCVGYFKPVFDGNIVFSDKITSASEISLGFQYTSRKGNEYMKPKAITDLYVSGSYNIWKGLSIYARLDNLLNKKYQYFTGIPAQGINFVGGISYSF